MCVTEYASDSTLAAACFECSSGNFFRALCFLQLHFCCTSLLSRRRLCVCVCVSLSLSISLSLGLQRVFFHSHADFVCFGFGVAASVRGAYDFYLFFHRFGIVEPLAEVRL